MRPHTHVLAGSDAVYDAAFRRAGLLRVLRSRRAVRSTTETLSGAFKPSGESPGDPDQRRRGRRARCRSPDRSRRHVGRDFAGHLRKARWTLPPTWSKANPIDIVGDADAARYSTALEALLADPENDAVLASTCRPPSPRRPRQPVLSLRHPHLSREDDQPKPVLAVWIGAADADGGAFDAAGIPEYKPKPTPCAASPSSYATESCATR